MSDSLLLDGLPVEQRLALAYAPVVAQPLFAGLFALDTRLAGIVRTAREPMLAQLRLAWWRDRLGQGGGQAEPVLAALAPLQGRDADLAALADGWEALLAERLDQAGVEAFLAGRAAASAALAQALHSARYAVLVWEAWRLPAQGALLVEAINRIVGTLNRRTRAATLPLGGGDGAATSNQVFTWLSGLPLRTRGAEHEPHLFDTERLLADGAVDLLVWANAFGQSAPPPRPRGQKLVLLAPPSMAAHAREPGTVFIPVATPGIGAAGHLFRTDGVVLMPLHAARDDGLPGLDAVARQLHEGLAA